MPGRQYWEGEEESLRMRLLLIVEPLAFGQFDAGQLQVCLDRLEALIKQLNGVPD